MKRNGHLTLDDQHRYFLNGRRILGVTEILSLSGWINDSFYTEEARYRGTYVHAACHIINTGRLNWKSLKPEYRGYAEAYQRFLEETGFAVAESEARGYHPTNLYAGTWDMLGAFPDRRNLDIGDIKTGEEEQWWKYQTAGYAGICSATVEDIGRIGRFSLKLTKHGRYFVRRHQSREDWKVFLACLTIANAKGGK